MKNVYLVLFQPGGELKLYAVPTCVFLTQESAQQYLESQIAGGDYQPDGPGYWWNENDDVWSIRELPVR